jgi:hypothetical protein
MSIRAAFLRYQLVVPVAIAASSTLTPQTIGAQAQADTLPRYLDVTSRSDSAEVVRAVNDALQGLSSLEVPMRTTRYQRDKSTVVVSLEPIPTPGVVWRKLAGTVRVLSDGRRVILSRE